MVPIIGLISTICHKEFVRIGEHADFTILTRRDMIKITSKS